MLAWVETVVGLGAAASGVIGKMAIDRWHHSGTIDSSDAGQLWTEAKEIREFLNQQIAGAQKRAGEFETKVDDLEKRVDALTDSNDGLRVQLEQAHQLVLLLRTERQELTAELDRARTWADVLVVELQRHDLTLPEKPKRRTVT